MTNSGTVDARHLENVTDRREQIARWAHYGPTDADESWSREQNRIVDSQLQSANALAANGNTDPVRFVRAPERLRDRSKCPSND